MGQEHESHSLSILTFNLHGTPFVSPYIGKRFSKIAAILNTSKHDVLCFQEVVTYRQLYILKKGLPSYPYVVFRPFVLGPKGALVIFSRIPITEISYINFSKRGTLRNASVAAHIIRNGILAVHLQDTPLAILNTHFTPNFDFDWTERNRFYKYHSTQIEDAVEAVNKYAVKNKNIILVGDFNIGKTTKLYESFVKRSKVTDIFADDASATYDPSRKKFFFEARKPDRIDYIFMKCDGHTASVVQKGKVFEDEVRLMANQTMFLSDHMGLTATVKFTVHKK